MNTRSRYVLLENPDCGLESFLVLAHSRRIPVLRRDGASEPFGLSSPAHTPLAHTLSHGASPKSKRFQLYYWILVGMRLQLGLVADLVLLIRRLENPECELESVLVLAHTWRIPVLRRDGASEPFGFSSPAHTPLAHTLSHGASPKSERLQRSQLELSEKFTCA